MQVMFILDNADPDDLKKVLFCAADLNHNGTISRDELSVILEKLGYNMMNQQHIAQLFDECKDQGDSMSYEMFNEVMAAIQNIFKGFK